MKLLFLLFLLFSITLARDEDVKITTLFKPDGCASARKAKEGDIVFVHYTGKLKDGRIFDTSEDKEPFQFTIGKSAVIEGWHDGIQGMCVGEQRRLTIPPTKAYGREGVKGRIPPDATLSFDLSLVSFDVAPPPTALDWLSSVFVAFGILCVTFIIIKNNISNPKSEPTKKQESKKPKNK